MKYTTFSEKHNTLYILSSQLLPNTNSFKAYKEAFKMPYPERIERFASDEAKREIKVELENHKGCKISEYCNA